MSDPSGPESLSATIDLVLAVRVVLSPGGQWLRGVVVDPESWNERPFVGLAGLCDALGEWVAEARRRKDDDTGNEGRTARNEPRREGVAGRADKAVDAGIDSDEE